ncbi:DUF1800 domain-containing protein [Psychroserpens sp. BH13MA-6]
MNQHDIKHLYWRAGFGLTPNQLQKLSAHQRDYIVSSLFDDSSTVTYLEVDTSKLNRYSAKGLLKNNKLRKEFRDLNREMLKEYNVQWIKRLAQSPEVLRERMTLFWTNHFVCRDTNMRHVQQYYNTLRSHALGHFGDFVKAISKEPAMLKYLNNKQNRKKKPNENFARELMELFTLGEGHYSEADIKESARAFTGYNNTFEGQFILRERQHDHDFKTFMGHTGRYEGDDIIDIILKQKQCAHFICRKIYSYFVNEAIDEQHVEEMTEVFYKDYDIGNLMTYVFMSDWFYRNTNKGTKIKSPVELLVGIQKIVPFRFNDSKDLFKIQKLLGQTLLNPPNVAGWKGGKSWIDSNTIMIRLKLPSILLSNSEISITEKGEFEDAFEAYSKKNRRQKFVNVTVNWETFDTQFKNFNYEHLKAHIIVSKLNSGTETYLESLKQSSKQDFCVQLMSLPEFQMC